MSIDDFIAMMEPGDAAIGLVLAEAINAGLPEAQSKIWHGHPVWFLDGNPTVGFSKQKAGVRLMFWSGKAFDEPGLDVLGGKFQDASRVYQNAAEIDLDELARWLDKSRAIRFDYANLAKRKGRLERIS